jgi:putative transcriptional regulator
LTIVKYNNISIATYALLNIFLVSINLAITLVADKNILLKQFGAHIKQIRLKKNLTQFDVACLINKDRQSIQRLESGKINPTVYYLFELAESLGVDFKTLTNFDFK